MPRIRALLVPVCLALAVVLPAPAHAAGFCTVGVDPVTGPFDTCAAMAVRCERDGRVVVTVDKTGQGSVRGTAACDVVAATCLSDAVPFDNCTNINFPTPATVMSCHGLATPDVATGVKPIAWRVMCQAA